MKLCTEAMQYLVALNNVSTGCFFKSLKHFTMLYHDCTSENQIHLQTPSKSILECGKPPTLLTVDNQRNESTGK